MIQGSGARLVASSQLIADGDTADLWLAAYCELQGGNGAGCPDFRTGARIPIGNLVGFVTLDGVPAAAGTIKLGGPVFGAVVVANGRGYEFTLDGDVDPCRLRAPDGERELRRRVVPRPEPDGDVHVAGLRLSHLVDPSWTVKPSTRAGSIS